jgi:hypothetical protein
MMRLTLGNEAAAAQSMQSEPPQRWARELVWKPRAVTTRGKALVELLSSHGGAPDVRLVRRRLTTVPTRLHGRR